MDKFFSLIQLVMSVFMLLCVITSVIAHTCMGNIKGFGFVVSFIFIYLTYSLVRISWQEYITEKNK